MKFLHSKAILGGRVTLPEAYSEIMSSALNYRAGTVAITYQSWPDEAASAKKVVSETVSSGIPFDAGNPDHVAVAARNNISIEQAQEADQDGKPYQITVESTTERITADSAEPPIGEPVTVQLSPALAAAVLAGELAPDRALIAQLDEPDTDETKEQQAKLRADLNDAVWATEKGSS